MATVVGKTSTRIDQLLADLVTTAAMVDGDLSITKRDGTSTTVTSLSSSAFSTPMWRGPLDPQAPARCNAAGPEPLLPPGMTDRDDWLVVP